MAFVSSKSHGAFFFLFENGTVRCGAVFTFSKPYGAVRGGFSLKRCGAVRIIFFKNRTVRCGAVRLSHEQLFSTVRLSVHRS